MSVDTSYSFQNIKRDLSEVFRTVNALSGNLLSIIPAVGVARSYKHEWLEDAIAPVKDALNGAILSTDTTVTVDDGSKFSVGQILRFEGYDEQMKITAISGNDLTVERGYGSTTAVDMSDNTVVVMLYSPKKEGSEAGYDEMSEPSVEYNYTQIFSRTARVSGSARGSSIWGVDDLLDRATALKMKELQAEMNNAAIYGRRVANTSDPDVPRNMGGILYFIENATSHITDASGAAITSTMINNLLEEIAIAGGRPDTLLCNTVQARKISAFNVTSGSEPLVQTRQWERSTGSFVREFVGDLPMGFIARIVVDTAFPNDKIALLTTQDLALVPMQNRSLQDIDATDLGADYFARRIIGEYTLEVRNAARTHGLIENLATS